ncbi:hypothetical protein BDR22DRAFT_877087 [Usnea florida]
MRVMPTLQGHVLLLLTFFPTRVLLTVLKFTLPAKDVLGRCLENLQCRGWIVIGAALVIRYLCVRV